MRYSLITNYRASFIDRPLFVSLRFDVRLLVTSLPTSIRTSAPSAIHPEIDETWEDLPSDAEDNFFLSPEEVEEYRLRKRLELMERNRLKRIRQAEESEAANSDPTEDIWGESDEEVRVTCHGIPKS